MSAATRRLETGIDVRGDVPDVILQGGVAVFQGRFHFADVIKDSGVILGKFLTDVGQGKIGQLPNQIHGHLPGFTNALGLLGAPKLLFLHGIELADLRDDQAGEMVASESSVEKVQRALSLTMRINVFT